MACDEGTGRKAESPVWSVWTLTVRNTSSLIMDHKLVDPSEKLQENICSRHDEVMKMFCCADQQCICCLCSVDEDEGNNTVSAATEGTERQGDLKGRERCEGRVREHQEKVEQEITELKRTYAGQGQLSHIEDHTEFLRNYPSLS